MMWSYWRDGRTDLDYGCADQPMSCSGWFSPTAPQQHVPTRLCRLLPLHGSHRHCVQGEPGFERLKRELEELKNAPRGLEGTYRTAAEMERHRAQAADAAIEEQLEVQTAFREHGAKLQSIYEVKQRTESEMSRREQEMKQLSSESPSMHSGAVKPVFRIRACRIIHVSRGA